MAIPTDPNAARLQRDILDVDRHCGVMHARYDSLMAQMAAIKTDIDMMELALGSMIAAYEEFVEQPAKEMSRDEFVDWLEAQMAEVD